MTQKIIAASLIAIGLLVIIAALNTTSTLRAEVEGCNAIIQRQQSTIDSLRDETFNLSTELGRVELTLEHLNEVDPDAFIEFSRYYDHETE